MKRTYFAEFNVNGFVPCGSDSYLILDGRNSISTQIDDCIERIERMKSKGFTGFAIRCGTFQNSTKLYTWGTVES